MEFDYCQFGTNWKKATAILSVGNTKLHTCKKHKCSVGWQGTTSGKGQHQSAPKQVARMRCWLASPMAVQMDSTRQIGLVLICNNSAITLHLSSLSPQSVTKQRNRVKTRGRIRFGRWSKDLNGSASCRALHHPTPQALWVHGVHELQS